MVETPDAHQQNKERASEIFQNIFSEIYLGSCNNPIEFDVIKAEIESHMKIQFDEATTWNIEQCFSDADTDNVSKYCGLIKLCFASCLQTKSLKKEQMRTFLLKCLESGIFEEFYAQRTAELEGAVEGLYTEYFQEAFNSSQPPGSLDRASLTALIHEKFQGDEFLIEELNNELEKHLVSPDDSSAEVQPVSSEVLQAAIRIILKSRMNALTSQREDQEAIIEELQQTTGGGYARQMIQRVTQQYKEGGLASQDPLQEIKDLLDLFDADEQINNF